MQAILQSGFPCTDYLIHAFIGGSEVHGAKVQGTDDLDVYGVFVETPEQVIGLDRFEHFVWSTSGNETRNGPDDIDVTLYSLRKWASMAGKGNPTALHFLFTKNHNSGDLKTWEAFSEKARGIVLAKSAAKQFIGFAD